MKINSSMKFKGPETQIPQKNKITDQNPCKIKLYEQNQSGLT